MAYNELLADRIRIALEGIDPVEEKAMFSGLCFMVDDKMCVCVSNEGLLCRIGAVAAIDAVEMNGCRQMTMGSRTMKDFVYVSGDVVRTSQQLDYWLRLCLAYNPEAKSSKKKK